MAASFLEIMEVKNFLKQQHIIVSEEWTEACIAFVKQGQSNIMLLQNLKKSVYQQWLLGDLEEISCPSLPPQLPTLQKITLSNNFALQVQGIRDISKPAYSQLKQLEGSINCNEEFSSAPKASVPEWEANPKRMLLLNLTDGCIHIQGMEYQPINLLSPNLSPGIKVLIKGPVDCRFGVLLLKSENIRILGGEVESKIQQFSRENILKEQLQLPTDEGSQEESPAGNSDQISNNDLPNHMSRNQQSENHIGRNPVLPNNITQIPDLPSNYRTSTSNSSGNIVQENHFNTNSHQSNIPSQITLGEEDLLDHFESDDDFEQNIDYEKIDEIENSQRPINESVMLDAVGDDCDIWQEDEDVVQEMMEFQDKNPEFKMPFEPPVESTSRNKIQGQQSTEVYSYLSTTLNNPLSECTITIKGFIITVLSKLECTPSRGWSLLVKINDGTATVDANIHDKVLEDIIGISAQDMMKKQILAAKNLEIRKQVMESISKCKLTLQNFNCLMDVKFSPGDKPCIMKCYPVSQLHIQQMLERVRSSF